MKKTINIFSISLLVGSTVFYFYSSLKGFNNNIHDFFAFRQTQTAISAYWILNGSSWLAYETPVFGYPWSVPFEFPLYQWIVAAITWASGTPLESAGRIVSIVFHLGTVAGITYLLRIWKFSFSTICIAASFMLLSPLQSYWSRTFLIESCATFFSVFFFIFFIKSAQGQKKHLVSALICGALAITIKVTTFWPVLAIASIWTLTNGHLNLMKKEVRKNTVFLFIIGIGILSSLFMWTHFADQLKSANILSQNIITSKALKGWNFGSVSQRLDLNVWKEILVHIEYIVGNSWVLIGLIPLLFVRTKANYFLIAFIVGPLTFINLYFVHEYYTYAVGFWLTTALGISIALCLNQPHVMTKVFGFAVIGLFVISSFNLNSRHYWKSQNMKADIIPIIGKLVEDSTLPQDVIIVNEADAYSSEIPYAAKRKSINIWNSGPDWKQKLEKSIALTTAAGYQISALIDCSSGKEGEYWKSIKSKLNLNIERSEVIGLRFGFHDINATAPRGYCRFAFKN